MYASREGNRASSRVDASCDKEVPVWEDIALEDDGPCQEKI